MHTRAVSFFQAIGLKQQVDKLVFADFQTSIVGCGHDRTAPVE